MLICTEQDGDDLHRPSPPLYTPGFNLEWLSATKPAIILAVSGSRSLQCLSQPGWSSASSSTAVRLGGWGGGFEHGKTSQRTR
ncbi:Protein of unknown function [Pyronema omphalodes CBS 100304]|uniref:Uncharacterized protein n=1 Tax=Pyronema omphalodes (strain CBS 100304) TaxID=1076935 RepID=U4L983_PYROM|nr:Protein of unknown function [Pyronema omphalodes CBS 100304]